MLREFGYCHGIENYSRHLSGRAAGEPPYTLINYFPEDFLIVIDESHATVPQIGGMYEGDRSGNRILSISVSGSLLPTTGRFNSPVRGGCGRQFMYLTLTNEIQNRRDGNRQIIRPTGLIDPNMVVKPIAGQVDDLLDEIRQRAEKGERVLVTTLTKKMAEDLTDHYITLNVRARYLHSDIGTLERIEILRDLRLGKFDVLVGVNLLREGLDLPEVSLVAILDADKEGFSVRAIADQTSGGPRGNGEVILYADTITGSMQRALQETERRRRIQESYNEKMKITPESVKSNIKDILSSLYEADYWTVPVAAEEQPEYGFDEETIKKLEAEMKEAAKKLEFERAATIRDKIREMKSRLIEVGMRK
jgi:excinuclease ABC subunit B